MKDLITLNRLFNDHIDYIEQDYNISHSNLYIDLNSVISYNILTKYEVIYLMNKIELEITLLYGEMNYIDFQNLITLTNLMLDDIQEVANNLEVYETSQNIKNIKEKILTFINKKFDFTSFLQNI